MSHAKLFLCPDNFLETRPIFASTTVKRFTMSSTAPPVSTSITAVATIAKVVPVHTLRKRKVDQSKETNVKTTKQKATQRKATKRKATITKATTSTNVKHVSSVAAEIKEVPTQKRCNCGCHFPTYHQMLDECSRQDRENIRVIAQQSSDIASQQRALVLAVDLTLQQSRMLGEQNHRLDEQRRHINELRSIIVGYPSPHLSMKTLQDMELDPWFTPSLDTATSNVLDSSLNASFDEIQSSESSTTSKLLVSDCQSVPLLNDRILKLTFDKFMDEITIPSPDMSPIAKKTEKRGKRSIFRPLTGRNITIVNNMVVNESPSINKQLQTSEDKFQSLIMKREGQRQSVQRQDVPV